MSTVPRTRPWDHPWRRTEQTTHSREVEKPVTSAKKHDKGLGDVLKTITVVQLTPQGKPFAKSAVISDVEYLASYNWVQDESKEHSIIIPGKPPRWAPPEGEMRLEPDSGCYPRDKNAFRYSQHPFEPAVIAMLAMSPDKLDKLDIVACSATLGRLLQFIRCDEISFRILVEVVDGVTFFTRREEDPMLTADGPQTGYGHTFPEAYTKWDHEVTGSGSHQRIIRYTFGLLNVGLRFEGDGFIADQQGSLSKLSANESDKTRKDWAHAPLSPCKATKSTIPLGMKGAGDVVAQDAVFELRTRAIVKKLYEDTFGSIAERLWLTQVGKFILAYHEYGTFYPRNIEIQDVADSIKQWEKDHNRRLSMLVALLRLIIAEAKALPEQKLEVLCIDSGRLEMRRPGAKVFDTLSPEVKDLWCHRSD